MWFWLFGGSWLHVAKSHAENTHDTKTVKPRCTRAENLPTHHKEKQLMIFFFFTSRKHIDTMAENTHWTFCEKRLPAACVHS